MADSHQQSGQGFTAELNPTGVHTALKVADMRSALGFYRDLIGLPFVRSQGPAESPEAVWLRGLQLIHSPGVTSGGSLDHIGLAVENIEAICDRLNGADTPVDVALEERTLPTGQRIRLAFYRDPEGNRVELVKYM